VISSGTGFIVSTSYGVSLNSSGNSILLRKVIPRVPPDCIMRCSSLTFDHLALNYSIGVFGSCSDFLCSKTRACYTWLSFTSAGLISAGAGVGLRVGSSRSLGRRDSRWAK
jgi:hypothetical protein